MFGYLAALAVVLVKCECPTGKFMCISDEKCINKNLVCNGEADCGDRSDELNCG